MFFQIASTGQHNNTNDCHQAHDLSQHLNEQQIWTYPFITSMLLLQLPINL